ncbi:MAG TPA: FAD-dependent monooxygenase [Lacipirellulaceae bacterium]|nr:FAD-dependent monooxygenase [Lacipirellulaceae bacterium]
MSENEILIIGAGPSGLFAASELARHGVQARLVERDLEPHREARATSIQPGTLEILNAIGLLEPFLETAERIHCSRMYGPGMTELGSMSHDGSGCCCEFQCSLPQYETRRILEEHLTSVGGHVERGVTATSVTAEDDGPRVQLTHQDGHIETIGPRFVIGAGGAHSVTRHSMSEPLTGTTYRGNFLVADIEMSAPIPRTEAGVICGPNGFLLLAPLPGGRWISFQDLEEGVTAVAVDEVIARVAARLDDKFRPADVAWFAPFRMHRRIVSRLADGRRFLIGDAAHLSSPFGGEGLNAGLHDGHDLAWKLALVLRGDAGQPLLDGYMAERRIADHHVLAVSDDVHQSVVDVADAARSGRELHPAAIDPVTAALIRNSRAMIDVDYSGSPLIADFGPGGRVANGPRPGQWYPDWPRFGGTTHRVLMFCHAMDPAALPRFVNRWSRLAPLSQNPTFNRERAGLAADGLVLIRPDGHIGFRFPATDAGAFAALDAHLASYLVPVA